MWIVAGRSTLTNDLLVGALHERGIRAQVVEPAKLSGLARRDDVVVGRLDVRGALDGVEDGIWELRRVERRGIRVLNPAPSLIACHDKLQTARRLARVGIPQPATSHVDWDTPPPRVDFPVVVKPRFGSGGYDVLLCESRRQLERCLRRLRDRTWFRRQGILVQALVPPAGFDLRLIVAGGQVVGAIERVAAEGEWRTNIALGGSRRPARPTPEACALATDAAAAVEGDLVGVDLLPLRNGGYVVLKVNGAVDFTAEYSLGGRDVFEEVARVVAWTQPTSILAVAGSAAELETTPLATERASIGALLCALCGALRVAARPAPRCAECGADDWVRAPWRPFTRFQPGS